jgi:hypothetical protein
MIEAMTRTTKADPSSSERGGREVAPGILRIELPAASHPGMRSPLLGPLERLVARGTTHADHLDGRLVHAWAGS